VRYPGTAPARPQHGLPVPSGVPQVGGGDAVTHLHRLQRAVADGYAAYRRSVPNGVAADELRDNKGVYGYSDAALALQPALDAVRADADASTQKVHHLLKGVRVDADQASQRAAQRYWARAQRALDAAKGPGQAVATTQRLIADADPSEINVLADELGSWLADHNLPSGWLPDALAQKVPGLADAAADAALKQKQLALLSQNHAMLQRSIANDVDTQPLLDPSQVTSQTYTNSAGF